MSLCRIGEREVNAFWVANWVLRALLLGRRVFDVITIWPWQWTRNDGYSFSKQDWFALPLESSNDHLDCDKFMMESILKRCLSQVKQLELWNFIAEFSKQTMHLFAGEPIKTTWLDEPCDDDPQFERIVAHTQHFLYEHLVQRVAYRSMTA